MSSSPVESINILPFPTPTTLPSSPVHTVTLSTHTAVMTTPTVATTPLHTSLLVTTHTPHTCAPTIIPIRRASDTGTTQNGTRCASGDGVEGGRVGRSEDGEEEPVVNGTTKPLQQKNSCVEQVHIRVRTDFEFTCVSG